MRTLDDSLLERYRAGLLAKDEMLRVAEHPGEILEKLGEQVPEYMRKREDHGAQTQQPQRPPGPGGQGGTR